MKSGRKTNPTTRFLTCSFIGLLAFSIIIFSMLAAYMTHESEDTIYDIGEIYMSGMNEKMSEHFETVIELRFTQVSGVVSAVSADMEREQLYRELIYRTKLREFDYLALCASDGTFETLYGQEIQPQDPEPFAEALSLEHRQIAVGLDSDGTEVLLFGVNAAYPMRDGGMSKGLVAALPLNYIIDFLSLNNEEELMYYHVIRPDGSFVVQNSSASADFFGQLSVQEAWASFGTALSSRLEYGTTLQASGEKLQIYGTPLPYSDWYLISVMPYTVLDDIINSLSAQRKVITLMSCISVLLLLTLIFFRYFSMTRAQLRELEQAQKAASEANRAKSMFLANMSHDIRTPMNAIVGMTAIATAHMDDPEQVRNCLRKITLSSKHLLGLINDVLDMSKIESGKLTLTMDQVSLKEIVEEMISIVQPQIKAKNQTFDIQAENILTENVWCDGIRLNQVLLNLLSNATKYTPEGGSIQLLLSQEPSPKAEDFVRLHICVKDNGVGMSQEFLERIYDSYSRADETRIHKTEGAGLGMAITKYIVDAMDGTIAIESEPGRGTAFHTTFDFKKASEPAESMMLPDWNMLVVDDDELLCQTTAASLASIGIHAEWTLSGESALELVSRRHEQRDDYQIILLDWKLPDMNGIQVARQIRTRLGDDIPILLISAYDWSEFEAEAREAGISGFLSKPLFKSTLFYGLRPYMDGSAVPAQSPGQNIDLSGRRILLAEDNELNWEVVRELLSHLGLELTWAEDGQICLDKFRQSSEGYYDAILMDIRMPNMTGYEAARAIRALNRPDAPSVPIIAMSADAFSDDIQRSLECGMNAHIAKPVNIGELTRILKRFIG